jgi:GNAT superfamily N-acetyltransferase
MSKSTTAGTIEIRRVSSRAGRRRFLTFPWKIYSGDPLWVPPLIPERMKVTNSKRGMFFQRGEAEFFAAYRDGKMVGTICAAEDPAAIEQFGRRECVFGFFESIEDRAVSDALFAAAESWARDRGLDSLLGPFNLDYEDGYGILTDGRDRRPVILCGHTPPYYQTFVEEAGFLPARAGNIALALDIDPSNTKVERLEKAAVLARNRARFVVRTANLKDWRGEARRVHHLLNNSLDPNEEGGTPWPEEAVEDLVKPFLKIADPDLVLFADVVSAPDAGKSVGWFAAVPNVNEILLHVNGLRYPWNYLVLLANLWRKPRCLAAKSLLVLPEYHQSGVAALLFDELYSRAKAKGYEWIDLSLTSEANPQTPIIAERVGAERYKRYQVYRRAISPEVATS